MDREIFYRNKNLAPETLGRMAEQVRDSVMQYMSEKYGFEPLFRFESVSFSGEAGDLPLKELEINSNFIEENMVIYKNDLYACPENDDTRNLNMHHEIYGKNVPEADADEIARTVLR